MHQFQTLKKSENFNINLVNGKHLRLDLMFYSLVSIVHEGVGRFTKTHRNSPELTKPHRNSPEPTLI